MYTAHIVNCFLILIKEILTERKKREEEEKERVL